MVEPNEQSDSVSAFLDDACKARVADLCRRFQVRRLSVFGSVLRADFPDSSDIDVAVIFDRSTPDGSFDQFTGLKESLEKLFGREIDLVSADRIRNPVFARELQNSEKVIYDSYESASQA